MKSTKKIIPVAIVLLFLGIAFTPVLNAGDSVTVNVQHSLNIRLDTGNLDYFKEVKVTKEQLNEVNESFEALIHLINDTMDINTPGGKNITEDEWEEIKNTRLKDTIGLIKDIAGDDFPEQECLLFIGRIIQFLYMLRWLIHPVFSVGIGFTWAPFYHYEGFIGTLLRPIWITYLFGFTATVRTNPFPPPIPYAHLGIHRLRTLFFTGLFIDFGDVGHDRIFGPVLVIGRGFTLTA